MGKAFAVGDRVRASSKMSPGARRALGDEVGTIVELNAIGCKVRFSGLSVWGYRTEFRRAVLAGGPEMA